MSAHALTPPRPGAPDPLFLPDLGTAFCAEIASRLPAGTAVSEAVRAIAERDREDADGPYAGWEFDARRHEALVAALAGLPDAGVPAESWDWLAPRLAAFRARTRSFPGVLDGMEAWDAEMARMQAAIETVRTGGRDPEGIALLGRRLPTLWS